MTTAEIDRIYILNISNLLVVEIPILSSDYQKYSKNASIITINFVAKCE